MGEGEKERDFRAGEVEEDEKRKGENETEAEQCRVEESIEAASKRIERVCCVLLVTRFRAGFAAFTLESAFRYLKLLGPSLGPVFYFILFPIDYSPCPPCEFRAGLSGFYFLMDCFSIF